MTNSSFPNPLSFPQAIAATKSLMEQIDSHELSEADIQQRVESLLSSKNGGRGFFVAYLTSDTPLSDRPSKGIINGLKSMATISDDLLVKNLAMSSAMTVAHSRNNDLENVVGSQRVCRRTSNLIQKLNLQSINEELQKLQRTLEDGDGKYLDFLQRWSYDKEQKKAIEAAISDLSENL